MTIQSFRKHISLLGPFFKASLMSELEYRFNIVVRIFTDIAWYAAQISVFEVLFQHTSSLNGWHLADMRAFMGVLFITDAIFMLLFADNLDQLGIKIRKGDLDLLLVKPVNSQFMLSFQKLSVAYAGNLLIAFGWLIWSLAQIPGFQWIQLLWLIITIPIGLSIAYAMRFTTAATALYFARAEAINYMWYQLYRLGTRPHSLYPVFLRYAVLSIMPIAFIASVPTEILLGKSGPLLLILGVAISAALLKLTTIFWRRGLRQYSSASS